MARKQKTIHYLYKTTCSVTGRYYIGMHSTCNLDDGYMGSGKRLRYSLRKHGKENHVKEILEYFETRELLIEAEKIAITPDMISDKDCMNLMSGGIGGFISKEHQKKCSIAGNKAIKKLLETDITYLKIRGDISRKIIIQVNKMGVISSKFKGKTHSDETKKLMSEIRKINGVGEGNSQYGTCWITREGINKKIKKEDLNYYINLFWNKGRTIL